jgi:hypothetical protein
MLVGVEMLVNLYLASMEKRRASLDRCSSFRSFMMVAEVLYEIELGVIVLSNLFEKTDRKLLVLLTTDLSDIWCFAHFWKM